MSVALLGFDRQPRGSLFISCICGAPTQCGKVIPSCKLTGRLPTERKPVDSIPQQKRSAPNSLFPRQQGFPCPDAIIIGIDDRRGHNPIFLIQSAANNQQSVSLTSQEPSGITGGMMRGCLVERERWRR